ncbi:MAG: alpha/beta hydrolase [Cypionkella sp.]|uniref:alpha/beta hydrolase n=1 Tax=Cypionkella sp. TaxID=2811411 RepID=UPI00261774E0|nr:alpha/beta hydrolase [Cypionkella sp.]MDB5660038.1 alpha/beta hydrolase [Cypionkella sp.]
MTEPHQLTTPQGRRIAYHFTEGQGPCVVFLGGFKSDMSGTKAVYLQDWAKAAGRGILRLDYSGHGVSSGEFLDGAIGDWFEDALAVINAVTSGPLVLVGSSMGGWIALLVAKAIPERIAGLVGIAAAPDFTEDSMWASATEAQRAELMDKGQIALPSEYSDAPYIITRHLIEEGRNRLVLRDALRLNFPTRLLQGTDDIDVPPSVALRLLDHAQGEDIRLTLVKGADHRFSTPACLALITDAVADVLKANI